MDSETTEEFSFERTEEERKAVLDAMLARERNPAHRRHISAIQDLDEYVEKAEKRATDSTEGDTDESSDSTSEIEPSEELDDLKALRKKMRGDFTECNLARPIADTAPAADTTSTESQAAPLVSTKDGHVELKRSKRLTWLDVSLRYLTETFKSEQYPTAKEFYKILERKAGPDSPFEKGVGQNSGSLFARETCEKVTYKMIQGFVTDIRKQR